MNKAPFMTALLVAVTSLTAVGCSSSSASTVFTHTNYTALGASDAMGVGSSVPCATAGIPAVPSPVSCPGGKGYVPVLAGFLTTSTNSVNLIDLGISRRSHARRRDRHRGGEATRPPCRLPITVDEDE